jgi:hypothetical protein
MQFQQQDYCSFCILFSPRKEKSKNYFKGRELAQLPEATRCSTAIDHAIFALNFEKAKRGGAISRANWAPVFQLKVASAIWR